MFLKENGVEFDTVAYKKTYHLDNDSAHPSCHLDIRFIVPKKSSKTDLTTLQNTFTGAFFGRQYRGLKPHEAIEKYTHEYIKNYINEAASFRKQLLELSQFEKNISAADNQTKETEKKNESKTFYTYRETLCNKIVYNANGILSFQVNQLTQKGENNRFETFFNYVINMKTGELLTETDIFVAGYDLTLKKLIINQLISQKRVKSIAELEDLGYFGIEEILPNKNFLITDKGITYTFNKGEYSAYQLDAPIVFLPYNILAFILKPNAIVSNLAK